MKTCDARMKETTKANCSSIHKYLCIRIRFFFESFFKSENQKKRERKVVNARDTVSPPFFANHLSPMIVSVLFSWSRNDRGQTRSRAQIQCVWILFVAPFALVATSIRSRDHVARSRKLEPTFTWRRLVEPGTSFSPSVPSSLLVLRFSMFFANLLISFWGNGPFSRQ